MRAHYIVDDPFGHARKNNHQQSAQDRTGQSACSHPRIPPQISKNAPNRLHSGETLSEPPNYASAPRFRQRSGAAGANWCRLFLFVFIHVYSWLRFVACPTNRIRFPIGFISSSSKSSRASEFQRKNGL